MATDNRRNGGAPGEVKHIELLLPQPKFELGMVMITKNALTSLTPADVANGIGRHVVGDWGDIDRFDRVQNEISLREGGRLLSAYRSSGGISFWISTEWDRSYTTVLLPEDY